jgi:tetratricopeptide (TPR) repeat protein
MTPESPAEERRRADALLGSGRAAEAVPLYRDLMQRCPGEESHQLAFALALYDSGARQEAADRLEQLAAREMDRDVFTGFAFDELVRIYRDRKEWGKLIALCDRAAAAFPGDAGLLRTLGDACLAGQQEGRALTAFGGLARLEPNDPTTWCALGQARLALGDPDGAEADYQRAAELAPEEKPRLLRRLAGLLSARYPERAVAALRRCLSLDPGYAPDGMALGDLLLNLGRPDEAGEAYAQAAAAATAGAGRVWHRLGLRLTEAGLHDQSAGAFLKAAADEPDNPRHLLRLAASYAALGRTGEARETLKRAESLLGDRKP